MKITDLIPKRKKSPNSSITETSSVMKKGDNCLICSHETKLFTETNNHLIYKCTNCGFGYTSKLSAQSGEYHRDETYIQEEELFSNIFNRRVKEITKFLKTGKVLEIGCSTGLMLSIFQKKGFNVKGVEISKKAAELAKTRGLEIITQPFEKIKFNEKFDLIILNHTLEHLENPLKILEKSKTLLNPKGYLLIDLPNFDSPNAKLFKKRWQHLLPEEHLWHFTQKSYEVLFKKLDFKIMKIKRASGVWDFANPYKEIYQSLTGRKKRFFKNILTAIPSLVMTKLNKGSDLLVLARKK